MPSAPACVPVFSGTDSEPAIGRIRPRPLPATGEHLSPRPGAGDAPAPLRGSAMPTDFCPPAPSGDPT